VQKGLGTDVWGGVGRVGAPHQRRALLQPSGHGVSSGGLFAARRLAAIEIGNSFLCLGGGGKYRTRIGFHHAE